MTHADALRMASSEHSTPRSRADDAPLEAAGNRFATLQDTQSPKSQAHDNAEGPAAPHTPARIPEASPGSTAETLNATAVSSPAAARLQQLAGAPSAEGGSGQERVGTVEKINASDSAVASLSGNFAYLRKAESDIAAINPGSRFRKFIKLGDASSGAASLPKPTLSAGDRVKKSQQWLKHTNRFPNDIRKSVMLENDVKTKLTAFNAEPTRANKQALHTSITDFESAVSAAKKEDKNARINDTAKFGFGILSSGIGKIIPTMK